MRRLQFLLHPSWGQVGAKHDSGRLTMAGPRPGLEKDLALAVAVRVSYPGVTIDWT